MPLKSRAASGNRIERHSAPHAAAYPFSAIVGQDEMKLALLLNAIDPSIGGVLIMGHRGTGKSTAVRALADLLPPITKARDCLYGCDPEDSRSLCADCRERLKSEGRLARERARVPVIDLPLGATEDRVCGTIDIERALAAGVKVFEPGLLARANRGFLYIDEVNLLEDHLIDLLLDVAVTGRNRVEREGVSIEHPSRFVLIGSGNPEEGELRPQLLDRFGLNVEVLTETDLDRRVQIVVAREAFERDPEAFLAGVEEEQAALRRRLARARKGLQRASIPRELLRGVAGLCSHLKIDGHRGELTIARAARALAALEGRALVGEEDVRRVGVMSLRHRLRRDPLEQAASGARVEQALDQLFPPRTPAEKSRKAQDDEGERGPSSSPSSSSPSSSGGRKAPARSAAGTAPDGKGAQGGAESLPAPGSQDAAPPDVGPRPDAARTENGGSKSQRAARGRNEKGLSLYNSMRGRYTRAAACKTAGGRIALDATLRTRAARGGVGCKPACGGVAPSDLRFKRFKRKAGTLFIFAIDTSGSMALNRIGQAKGALARLLRRSYIRRDRVALVAFRGQRADVLLPPSAGVTRAARMLDQLSIGGPTPLAAGIFSSLELARRAQGQGLRRIVLLLFTDGHANVSLRGESRGSGGEGRALIWRELEQLGAELRRARVAIVVVDTRPRFLSGGEGPQLADRLGGRHVYLSSNMTTKDELHALGDEAASAP